MSESSKSYDDPSDWEYDGGSQNWTGDFDRLPPHIRDVFGGLEKQAFPDGKEAFQKQREGKK